MIFKINIITYATKERWKETSCCNIYVIKEMDDGTGIPKNYVEFTMKFTIMQLKLENVLFYYEWVNANGETLELLEGGLIQLLLGILKIGQNRTLQQIPRKDTLYILQQHLMRSVLMKSFVKRFLQRNFKSYSSMLMTEKYYISLTLIIQVNLNVYRFVNGGKVSILT